MWPILLFGGAKVGMDVVIASLLALNPIPVLSLAQRMPMPPEPTMVVNDPAEGFATPI